MKNRKKCEKRAYTRIKREGFFKVSVVGIITNQNNIIEIEEKIQSYKINEKNIIIITKENVSNIKNVKFDMIIIFDQIEEDEEIKKVVRESKYVLLNSDYKENLKLIDEHTNSYVITFGYNSRASITIISNENDEIILEIQREIDLAKNKKIECQEIKMNNNFAKKYIYEEIAMKILTILLKI